jgi:hypothetical protein
VSTTQKISGCGVLLLTVWAVRGAAAQPPDPAAVLSEVSVVPRMNQWSLVEPEARAALKQVATLQAENREELIRDGDARQRGIGLFIADQQGDIELLLSLAPLLKDEERTVPYAAPVAHVGGYDVREQTVSAYLSSIYLHWFGVEVDGSMRRFERLLGDVEEPAHLVNPWLVRLRRARGDEAAVTQLKERIAELPEQVRWAVLTLGYQNSLYTFDEARDRLRQLSPAMLDRLQNRDDLLPSEPLFRQNRGNYRSITLRECRDLLEAPAD